MAIGRGALLPLSASRLSILGLDLDATCRGVRTPSTLLVRRNQKRADFTTRHHHSYMKPNRRRVSSQSNSGWQNERAARLHRQFQRVEVARLKGKSVKAALSQFCWYWRGERYRSNPRITVQFSLPRVRTLFYQWRANGRTPEAIALHYRPGNRRIITRREIARFVGITATPGIFTFAAAFEAMQRSGRPVKSSPTHFFSALPVGLRKELRRLFYGRRQQRGIEIRFKRFLVTGGYYA